MIAIVNKFATIVTSIIPQSAQHEEGLLMLIHVPDYPPQVDEIFVGVQRLGHDEAAIEWI